MGGTHSVPPAMPAAQLPATPPTDTMVKATREVKRQDLADTAGWMHLFICARRISAKSVDENDPELQEHEKIKQYFAARCAAAAAEAAAEDARVEASLGLAPRDIVCRADPPGWHSRGVVHALRGS